MPTIKLPFETNTVEPHEGHIDLTQCGIYRILPAEMRGYVKESMHVLEYLHVIPIDRIGTPKFYTKLLREMKGMHNPNLIYPVNQNLAVHICPGEGGERNSYIPIEPFSFKNYDVLLDEVDKRIVGLVDKYGEPEEEKKIILEKCIDEVCEPNGNGGKSWNFWNHNTKKIHITRAQLDAIKYIMIRDKVGMGILEPFLQDPYLEDITCSGLGPIFVEHSIFEALKSPIIFEEEEDLDAFVLKLSEKVGKPITYKHPIVDAALPDGSRLNIVFGNDVSKKGSNFSIRKFGEIPFSVFQLIEFGTMDYTMAAYFWLTISEGMNIFISGETASGKTTTMNALTTFIRPNAKIVSIEDTPELQVPHKNWTREVTRGTVGKKEAEISMFDLLKAALRQRPNEIIIGEMRGVEANIAFQAMQTGHSEMSTFHAASVEKLLQRLTGDPLNVPKTYLDNLNIVVIQNAIRGKDGNLHRRVTSVDEILGFDPVSNSVSYIQVFRWNPEDDSFSFTGNLNSYLLENKIAVNRGIPENKRRKIYKELEKRAGILEKIHKSGATNFYELFSVLSTIEKEGVI